jgi:hypothetical protein
LSSNSSDFPHSNTDFPIFFHTALKIRKNAPATALIFFTIESDHTDGIDNIRQTPSVLTHLQSKKTYIYMHKFPSFETVLIGSLFRKSHEFTNLTILQNSLIRHLNKFLASPSFKAFCNNDDILTEPKTNPLALSNPAPLPIYKQDKLEQAILDRNSIHFRQADKTPFSSNYLTHIFGPTPPIQ